jgi:hypothetical protein
VNKLRTLGIAIALLAVVEAPAVAQVAGVEIDTNGVLSASFSRRESASIAAKRMQAFAAESLSADVTPFSELRMVSLRAVERQLEAAGSAAAVPIEVRHLFGLQRIDYIFLDDAAGDVVVSGPAEGFAPDAAGRMVGLTTGRPPLHLDDLLVALRWSAATGGRGQIGCSIDPVAERQADLQRWLAANSSAVSRDVAEARYDVMARILGRQVISVFNVPADSHFARVLVEADYRMKLIALGKEQPGVKGLRSQLSLITPQGNSIQRWWFVPLYDPIGVDEAGVSFQLSGQRLQLLAQDEWADGRGRRGDAAYTRASTEKFAQLFTEHVPELAAKSPVFAELQNTFDLAVLAALSRREQWSERLDWSMAALLDADRFPVQSHPVPTSVDSLSATVNRNRFVLGMVGGVTLDPADVLGTRRPPVDAAAVKAARALAIQPEKTQSAAWWNR